MSRSPNPSELPVPLSREVLSRRPPLGRPPLSRLGQRAHRNGTGAALTAFARQVLLRPTRVGTLALLGAMTAFVLVGAEGWWIMLGIVLFQTAAATLTVMWVDLPAEPKQPAGTACAPGLIPRQRRPPPGE